MLETTYFSAGHAERRRDGKWWIFAAIDTIHPMGWIIEDQSDGKFEAQQYQGIHIAWYNSWDDALRGLREFYLR